MEYARFEKEINIENLNDEMLMYIIADCHRKIKALMNDIEVIEAEIEFRKDTNQ